MKRLHFLILVVLISACSKKSDPSPSSTSSTQTDYLPTTTGTSWTYTGDAPYTLKMTGNTKTFNGNSYAEVQQTMNGQSMLGYVRKDNGSYYERGSISGTTSLGTDIEVIILKDNVAAGTTWSQNLTLNGISTTYKFTIDSKDISLTVLGKTYNKVIKVRMDTTIPLISTDPVLTEYLYFAYGIGLVQNTSDTFELDLQSYTIK